MDYAIQQLLNALAFGSEYALIALGLALVYSIMNLMNFAHGEIIACAGYSMYLLLLLGIGSPWLIAPIAVGAGALTAIVFERVAFRPVRHSPTTTGLLTALGVSIVVQNLITLFISPRPRAVPVFSELSRTIFVGPYAVSLLQILELGVVLLAIGGLVLFLRRSLLGLAIRAATREFSTVRLMGIRANRVIAAAFALSGLLAGIAAIFIVARRGSIDPDFGFQPVIKAFVACVIGGFGSLGGAVFGGMLLGFLDVAIVIMLPQEYGGLSDAITYSIIAALLVWRPDGLLTRRIELGDKEI
ncbi:MAG: branched-chain amino acid ABC transporter permease [Rhizobiales bacterium]|nr:branched-chain amino acid ABC transporter permease [Hyphomicrobiales bacterium]